MDKGSVIVAKDDIYWVYGLFLGIPCNGEQLSPVDFNFLSVDETVQRDLLFDSLSNFAKGYCSLLQVPMLFSIFRSKEKLSTKSVIKGFQKYSLFTTFDVEDNKVRNKREILEIYELVWYQKVFLTKGKVLVEDIGLDLDTLYIKSCLAQQRNFSYLLSIKDYKKDLLPALKEYRKENYDNFLDDYVQNNTAKLLSVTSVWNISDAPFDIKDLRDSTVYIVKTHSMYHLFLHIFDDLYVEVGKVNLDKSSKHNIGYFLALVYSRDDFIMQELYKPVKHHFTAFIEKNIDKIDAVVPLYGIVVDDLDIDDRRLKLSRNDYETLKQYYWKH